MTLIQSWKDSLTLLKPKNAQLFIMVTIKSIMEAYKLLFYYYWWWAIALIMVCYGFFSVHAWSLMDASGWLYQLLLFATCLATRPSIMKKDCAYFRSHMYAFLYMIILLIVLPKFLWPSAISSFYIFWVLFFLDSAQEPKDFFISIWNAIKLVIFNLPLLLIIGMCFTILNSVFSWVFWGNEYTESGFIVYKVVVALLMPIGVCTYANIYIKRLHDQFDLYFQQP